MNLTELKALLDDADQHPWKLTFFKGETECGHPVECDWERIANATGVPVELADPRSVNTTAAVAFVNAAPALIACAEALQSKMQTHYGFTWASKTPEGDAQRLAHERALEALSALEAV